VAGLVEWPVVHLGKIEPDFLTLPLEVVTTPFRVHQRYFLLRCPKTKKIAPWFGVVVNGFAPDGEKKCSRAQACFTCTSDGRPVFWQQDTQIPLEIFAQRLGRRQFFDKLGTLHDKTETVKAFFFSKNQHLLQAAALCKADLISSIVAEFPELRGMMGMYYARHHKLPEETAVAMGEQYSGGAEGISASGALLGILDRMDTLVGFFLR